MPLKTALELRAMVEQLMPVTEVDGKVLNKVAAQIESAAAGGQSTVSLFIPRDVSDRIRKELIFKGYKLGEPRFNTADPSMELWRVSW